MSKNKKATTLYVVGGVERTHPVKAGAATQDLDLTWADDMIGVLPVFKTEKAARAYAGEFTVFKINVIEA